MLLEAVTEGVYFLFDKGEIVYIGESDNLYRRIGQHIYTRDAKKDKEFDSFVIYPTADRMRLEGFLIRLFKPKYNYSMGADYTKNNLRNLNEGGNKCYFPTACMQIEEAIKKYDEFRGDPTVTEIADELDENWCYVLKALKRMNAPVYKIDEGQNAWGEHVGKFRVDAKWYKQHKKEISKFIY
jgi:hypothetical protein